MQAKDTEASLRQALERSKQQVLELTQVLANTKRENLMQTQTLQGAIEETRRMLNDHLDQTARHIEETQRCPEASPLADLVAMLAEARERVVPLVERRKTLESEKSRLEQEVKDDE